MGTEEPLLLGNKQLLSAATLALGAVVVVGWEEQSIEYELLLVYCRQGEYSSFNVFASPPFVCWHELVDE